MEETSVDIAARRFLRNGTTNGIGDSELASYCDREIQKAAKQSFRLALRLAQRFAQRASPYGGVLAATAYRSLARVSHLSGKHCDALTAYLKARRLLTKDPLVRARVDRALIDVYMYLGNLNAARRYARYALATFKLLRSESDVVQTEVNLANILHRQDRHRDAERLYRKAAEYFEQIDHPTATARCYFNRANTLVQLFELDTAEELYRRAIEIYERENSDLDANDSRYGLAWLKMLRGEFHLALLELGECERRYQEGGDPRGAALCLLDRAEVYLGLGLYEDALESARLSERKFVQLGLRYEQAKAALFRGQAAVALGKSAEARRAQHRAESLFRKENNLGFAGAAQLLAATLDDSKSARQRKLLRAKGLFVRAQLPLWQAVCDLHLTQFPSLSRRALRQLMTNRAAREVPHLFAAWQTVLGDSLQTEGKLAAAKRCWLKATDRLDAVRAQLPPLDLRVAFAKGRSSPHRRLVRAELDSNPAVSAVWSERYKTAGVWAQIGSQSAPAEERQAVTGSLEALARQVVSLSQQLKGGLGERGFSVGVRNRILTRLQKQVREQLLKIETQTKPDRLDLSVESLIRKMREASYSIPIVQFHVTDSDLIAFVHREGEIGICRFPHGVRQLARAMARWRFLLERELLAGRLQNPSSIGDEEKLWRETADWLWRPLGIDSSDEPILLIPEGELCNLPWRALIVDDQPLLQEYDFILAPSFRHFLAARQVKMDSAKTQIFCGTTDGLPEVETELKSLARFASAPVELYSPCRRHDWPSEGEAGVWHFAGHSQLRTDNPFYSYLLLEDGPLFAADFRLKNCRVNLVTLAACRSGEQVALPGEEATGLVRSLLEMGARNVIAGHWPVSDKATALWMDAFYTNYFSGSSILQSVRLAAERVRCQYGSAYYWGAFSVFGSGE